MRSGMVPRRCLKIQFTLCYTSKIIEQVPLTSFADSFCYITKKEAAEVIFPATTVHEGVSKSFWTESITKYMLTTTNTRWEATQRVMAAKLTRLTHKIPIQLHLVAESCTICSSRCWRLVRKPLDTPSYSYGSKSFRTWPSALLRVKLSLTQTTSLSQLLPQ
jgi:hypothetical protein